MSERGRVKQNRLPSQRKLMERCFQFNREHQVGTKVRYYPVIGEPEFRERTTRSEAFLLSGHTACIFLEGESGCVALDAIEVVG